VYYIYIYIYFYNEKFRVGDGVPVQGREDLKAQRTLTKVSAFTSLHKY
jgi:hypothetical protein